VKILFVSAECAPFAKTGGLADVVGALPKYLRRRGADVRVVIPLYAGLPWDRFEVLDGVLSVPMWYGPAFARVRCSYLPKSEVPIYFLEYNRYFDRPYLYGPPDEGYSDNLERFTFLSRGSIELCKALGFTPDVVHANDWHAALAPVYMNTVEWMKPLYGSASVYTIHNLAYQGVLDGGAMFITGLGREHYQPGEFEHFGSMNLMKAAIAHSTVVTTVSPTYSREIQTGAYGCGLDGELAKRNDKLFGILNGIDTDEWDPWTDARLIARYDADHPEGKVACKVALQKEVGLPVRADVPLFCFVGRLVDQKGVDLLAHALQTALDWDMQFMILGTGDWDAERYFSNLARFRADKAAAFIGFNNDRAHKVIAGSDFLVMPSRFEPCGLSQLNALRYGTLPVVRATGGLIDTVQNYDEGTGAGTGFMFYDSRHESLADTIGWAIWSFYNRPEQLAAMRKRAMKQDFTWERSAREYDRIYRLAYQWRRGHPLDDGGPID
jgi:starch synthase